MSCGRRDSSIPPYDLPGRSCAQDWPWHHLMGWGRSFSEELLHSLAFRPGNLYISSWMGRMDLFRSQWEIYISALLREGFANC